MSLPNEFKTITVAQLEAAFAEAVERLLGAKPKVTITGAEYSSENVMNHTMTFSRVELQDPRLALDTTGWGLPDENQE